MSKDAFNLDPGPHPGKVVVILVKREKLITCPTDPQALSGISALKGDLK